MKENSIELETIAKSFGTEEKLLADLISSQSYIFWEMKHEGIVKGVLYIERYKDLHALSQQVLDTILAKKLWENNISFELSYNIGQEFQGKGLGAKMVQLWTEQTKTLPRYASVFATVNSYNKNSIHLLEKYANFKKVGHFPLSEEEVSLYISAFKTFKTSS